MEMVRDCPTLMRHLWNEFFSVGGLMLMFRIRILLCFVAGLMYVFSPLDIIPEGVFGVLGLLDDIFVLFLLAMYISIIYRRLVVSRRMATWYTISLFFAIWHICDTSLSFVCMHYLYIFWYSRTPLTWTPVIRIASYPVRLGPSVICREFYKTDLPWNYQLLDQVQYNIMDSLMRMQVIQIANYPVRLGPSGKFVENSTKLTYLEISGYWIKYSTVLWLLLCERKSSRSPITQFGLALRVNLSRILQN